jgi:hypothetical protein
MSGSPAPVDNSDKVAQIEAQSAKDAQAAQDAKDAAARTQFNTNVSGAYNSALAQAQQYFTSMGLDPNDYMPQITSTLSQDQSSIPDLASTPGSYFTGAGQTAYNSAQDAKRALLQREINQFAPSGFETKDIASTAGDATVAAILAEQRQSADNYVKNLLDRGVINSGGYQAAENDLSNQSYGAKARLQDIDNQVLQSGRTNISNLANEARSGAANYTLGDNFDPYDYSTQINSALQDFFTNLGGNIRGQVPTGLFSTAGLANLAGAAQGAQNLAFSPAALAGTTTTQEDKNNAPVNFANAF